MHDSRGPLQHTATSAPTPIRNDRLQAVLKGLIILGFILSSHPAAPRLTSGTSPTDGGTSQENCLKHHVSLIGLVLAIVLTLVSASGAMAQGWSTNSADDYGFSMLVPEGTTIETKQWKGGWGGLVGESEGVTVIRAVLTSVARGGSSRSLAAPCRQPY